jgi:hypothetical protein
VLRPGLAWQIPAAVICALVAGYVFLNLPGPSLANVSGDTVTLVHGARRIADCLSNGIYSNCDNPTQLVGQFPPFQYIPAFVFTQLGLGDLGVLRVLSIASLLSFCALVGLSAWTASRTGRPSVPAVTVLILATSPLIYYAWSSFGESLAALLVALSAIAALRRWPPMALGLTSFLACLTKDSIFPIILVLGAVSLWATPIGTRPLRRGHWIALATGVFLGVVATAGFNWFRWHQVTNRVYFAPDLQAPGTLRRLGQGVALWLSPNGGTGWFWPLATALVIGVIAIACRELTRRPVAWVRAAPALGIVAIVLAQTVLLASWFDPFGWIAWGPRLMLPVIPAIVVIGVVIYSREIDAALRIALARPVRAVLVTTIVLVMALPQVNVLHAVIETSAIFAPDATCPTTPIVQTDTPAYYYGCQNHRAWGVHWVLPDSYMALERAGGAAFAVAFGGLWAWLLLVGTVSLPAADRSGRRREPSSVFVGTASS